MTFPPKLTKFKKIKNLISHQGKLAAVFTGEDFFFFLNEGISGE